MHPVTLIQNIKISEIKREIDKSKVIVGHINN